jgi:hypothetical protein
VRVDQHKRCSRPQGGDIQAEIGAEARTRRHSRLRVDARKRRGQAAAERLRQDFIVHTPIFTPLCSDAREPRALPSTSYQLWTD